MGKERPSGLWAFSILVSRSRGHQHGAGAPAGGRQCADTECVSTVEQRAGGWREIPKYLLQLPALTEPAITPMLLGIVQLLRHDLRGFLTDTILMSRFAC